MEPKVGLQLVTPSPGDDPMINERMALVELPQKISADRASARPGQVIVRTDRRCQLGRAGHGRLGAAFQAAKRGPYRLYARGKNVLRVDDDTDTDALQLRVAGHE